MAAFLALFSIEKAAISIEIYSIYCTSTLCITHKETPLSSENSCTVLYLADTSSPRERSGIRWRTLTKKR